jgi:GNAT superfamily N-acetyltransferase
MTEADRIVAMAQRFHAAINPAWPWDADDMLATVQAMQERDDCFVASTAGGFILGTLQANPMSRGYLIAKEFLWWSEDGTGAALMRQFKQWAKRRGADEIQLSCPAENHRVQRVYSRTAQPSEIIYSEFV